MPLIHRWVIPTFVAGAFVLCLAQPAGAVHADAVVDCGTAGTFVLKTIPTGSGFDVPGPTAVLLFEGGGTLSVLEVSRNGQLIWEPASVGLANNSVDEATCTFALSNGVQLEITGVLTSA